MSRTFRDRWFTWPWRPWVKTRMCVLQLPDPGMYAMEDLFNGKILMMHPETLHAYKEKLGVNPIV